MNESDPIKNQFKKRIVRQLITALSLVPVVIMFGFLGNKKTGELIAGIPDMVFIIPGIALLVTAIAFSFYNWRCPACNKYLGRYLFPKKCPWCNAELR